MTFKGQFLLLGCAILVGVAATLWWWERDPAGWTETVSNGDFRRGLAGWTVPGPVRSLVAAAPVNSPMNDVFRDNRRSVLVRWNPGADSVTLLEQAVRVESTRYRLSFDFSLGDNSIEPGGWELVLLDGDEAIFSFAIDPAAGFRAGPDSALSHAAPLHAGFWYRVELTANTRVGQYSLRLVEFGFDPVLEKTGQSFAGGPGYQSPSITAIAIRRAGPRESSRRPLYVDNISLQAHVTP